MKKLMYIFLVFSVLTGCKEKKDAGAMKGMPTLAISVAKPIVKDITLTKDYPVDFSLKLLYGLLKP